VRDAQPPLETRVKESDPFPSPPRAIGVAGVSAEAGRCPRGGTVVPAIAYDRGWFPQEYAVDLDGRPFRWIDGQRAVMTVGGEPGRRVLRFAAQSFLVPRRLRIQVDGRVAARVSLPANRWREFSVTLPAGAEGRRIVASYDPPPLPAARVNGADKRLLGIALTEPDVRGGA
jgi:hypothetical protein